MIARASGKPCLVVDASLTTPAEAAVLLAVFILRHHIIKLNVAGPRASNQPAIYGFVHEVIDRLFTGRTKPKKKRRARGEFEPATHKSAKLHAKKTRNIARQSRMPKPESLNQ